MCPREVQSIENELAIVKIEKFEFENINNIKNVILKLKLVGNAKL